ncbi:MAG: AbrB family transcriptional regulator [Clostridia bacterium]|nr:AbrB family transcriptional regulator [Clostridia bacterium]
MKPTGVVRKMDLLGRIVIPSELREAFEIYHQTELEIIVNGNEIRLSKHKQRCYICLSTKELELFKDRQICSECIEFIKDNL